MGADYKAPGRHLSPLRPKVRCRQRECTVLSTTVDIFLLLASVSCVWSFFQAVPCQQAQSFLHGIFAVIWWGFLHSKGVKSICLDVLFGTACFPLGWLPGAVAAVSTKTLAAGASESHVMELPFIAKVCVFGLFSVLISVYMMHHAPASSFARFNGVFPEVQIQHPPVPVRPSLHQNVFQSCTFCGVATQGGACYCPGCGEAYVGHLTNGWEACVDQDSGRRYYVNHNNGTTQLQAPTPRQMQMTSVWYSASPTWSPNLPPVHPVQQQYHNGAPPHRDDSIQPAISLVSLAGRHGDTPMAAHDIHFPSVPTHRDRERHTSSCPQSSAYTSVTAPGFQSWPSPNYPSGHQALQRRIQYAGHSDMGQMGYQQQQPQTGMQSHIQSQMEMQAHMQWQPHMQPYMQTQLGMGMPLQPHMQPHMQPQLGMGMTFNHMMPELGPQLPHGESPSMTVDTEFVDLESLCADNDWEVHSVERSDMIHPESEINQGSYSHVLFSNVVGQDAIPDEVSEQRAEQVSLQGLQKFAGSNAEECQQQLSEYYDRFQQTHPGLKRLKSREGVLKLRCRGGCGVKITYWRKSGSAHKGEKWRASKNNTYQHSGHCLAVSVSRFKKPRRAIKSSSTAKSAIEVNPRIQGPAFSNLLHKYDPGELPSPRTIRRILFEMRQDQSLYDEDEHADVDYQAIPSACQTFCEKNPGSVAVCETNDAVMAEIFAAADPDQEGTASRSALCSVLTKNGYDEKDIKEVFDKMPLHADEGAQAIRKDMFMEHFGSKFGRFCIIFRAQVLRCVRGGKLVWAADGAFCKPGSGFPGQLLNLTGVDSQGSPVTVGYALVMSENADAYRWFFEHASNIQLDDDRTFGDVLNSGDSVMFSDRQKGLRSAVQLVFPDCHHLLCCHHLLDNCRKNVKKLKNGEQELEEQLFWRVQGSVSESDFDRNIQSMRRKGFEHAADYLCGISDGQWLLYKWVELGAVTYGWKTSNQAEITNSALLPQRELPPLRLLTALIFREMHNLYSASERACQWLVESQAQGKRNGQVMTDHAQTLCTQFNKNSGGWFVRPISNQKALVTRAADGSGTHSQEFVVQFPTFVQGRELADETDMTPGTCSCLVPQIEKVYCQHVVAAEREYHKRRGCQKDQDVTVEELVMDWVSSVHLITTYRSSCANLHINPVMVREMQLDKCYPWRTEAERKVTPGPAKRLRRDWRCWVRGKEGDMKRKGITESDSGSAHHLTGRTRTLQQDDNGEPDSEPVAAYTPIDGFEKVTFEDLIKQFKTHKASKKILCWTKSRAFMQNKNVAHVFADHGWCVGTVKGSRSPTGEWDVKYKGFPEVYKHQLEASDYDKVWVIVQKS